VSAPSRKHSAAAVAGEGPVRAHVVAAARGRAGV